MQQQLYRLCRSRKEAEGLTRAIMDRLGAADTVILTDDDGNYTSLLHGAKAADGQERDGLRGDVDINIRESRVNGMFQMTIRTSHGGHMARVREALTRRRSRPVAWPVRMR